jgi:glutamate dehydrogenase/leucine dehydrogenase
MEIKIHNIGDNIGPEKILLLRQPRIGLEAIVVVDNVACGPAIGGVRMAKNITIDEVYRLSRAMTLKNAVAGLPHGGAKSESSPTQPVVVSKRRYWYVLLPV